MAKKRLSLFEQTAVVAVTGAVAVALGLRYGLHLSWAWSLLAAINIVTFAAYYYDKTAAGRGALRVPEATLHFLALLGGSPAALAGQQFLRHKSAKRPFLVRFWMIVGAQLVAAAYFVFR